MPDNTKTLDDLTSAMDVFRQELPNPITSLQSSFLKEMVVDNEKVTLVAQKCKGSNGMAWNVNVSKYKHN